MQQTLGLKDRRSLISRTDVEHAKGKMQEQEYN